VHTFTERGTGMLNTAKKVLHKKISFTSQTGRTKQTTRGQSHENLEI